MGDIFIIFFFREIKACRGKYLVDTSLRNTRLCIQGDSNGISTQQLAMGKTATVSNDLFRIDLEGYFMLNE